MLCFLVACKAQTPEDKAQDAAEEAAKEREKQEEYDRARRLERYYELEWVRCVNDLGIDRCKVIQETGFHQCKSWEFKEERGMEKCAAHRLEDRLEAFPDEPAETEAVADATTKAAEPLPAEAFAEEPMP